MSFVTAFGFIMHEFSLRLESADCLSIDSILPLDDDMGWCDFMLLQVNKKKGEFEGFILFLVDF